MASGVVRGSTAGVEMLNADHDGKNPGATAVEITKEKPKRGGTISGRNCCSSSDPIMDAYIWMIQNPHKMAVGLLAVAIPTIVGSMILIVEASKNNTSLTESLAYNVSNYNVSNYNATQSLEPDQHPDNGALATAMGMLGIVFGSACIAGACTAGLRYAGVRFKDDEDNSNHYQTLLKGDEDNSNHYQTFPGR